MFVWNCNVIFLFIDHYSFFLLLKQPCVKVAWDCIVPSELSLYVKNWREIACHFFNSIPDYIAIQGILRAAIEHLGID